MRRHAAIAVDRPPSYHRAVAELLGELRAIRALLEELVRLRSAE